MGKLNKQDIQKAVEEIFNSSEPKGRRFLRMVSYCHGRGYAVDYADPFTFPCEDDCCGHCKNIRESMKDVIDGYVIPPTKEQ